MLWVDVTDVVEFLATGTTVSGVQRVCANLVPHLVNSGATPVAVDRTRGHFVELTDQEVSDLLLTGVHSGIATASDHAATCLTRLATAEPVNLTREPHSVLLALGAVWINDQLMAAIRQAVRDGVRFVDLFYDLTPVLDAGHSAQLRPLFERYLALLADCASRVPAISQSSRADLTTYTAERTWRTPPGSATGLPSGLLATMSSTSEPNTSEPNTSSATPYALMVGTIEARKNHMVAFSVWQELIARHGAESIPTLMCVGKIGWNSEPFLDALAASNNLNGKIEIRTDSVSDTELAELYRNCEFSIYPSAYEGWGLPVTESLYFGAPVIASHSSSLPEAGGDLALYAETGNVDDFVRVIETNFLDQEQLTAIKERIARSPRDSITWESVAQCLEREVTEVTREPLPPQVIPTLTEWHTYSLGAPHSELTDRLLIGDQRPPQPWGIPLHCEQSLTFCFTRPVSTALTAHLGTLNEPGQVSLRILTGDGISREFTFSRGEYVGIDLGSGEVNAPVTITVTATDVGASDHGFIGLTSLTVEGESVMASEDLENFALEKLQAENAALRTDIAQITRELTDARAELERKSQGLLSRASRRLNRPVKD